MALLISYYFSAAPEPDGCSVARNNAYESEGGIKLKELFMAVAVLIWFI